jgi:predicted Kef-type K+ transport protein
MAGKITLEASLAIGIPARAALTAAVALGQMGEFSFIFASVALEEGAQRPAQRGPRRVLS